MNTLTMLCCYEMVSVPNGHQECLPKWLHIEEINMKPPPGLCHSPRYVCRLRQALYGLKWAPQACLLGSMKLYVESYAPKVLKILLSIGIPTINVSLCMLTMIITGNDQRGIQQLK